MGGYMPAHYLKQFHPKFATQEAIDKAVADTGVDNWVKMFKFKSDWSLNPDLPVMAAWKTVSPINKTAWVLERNPYYFEVDTEGNQLPYIDKIQMSLAENLEVVNLRAIAGEYDIQERHTDLAKLPVYLENQQRSNFKVYLDPRASGADTTLHFNLSYEADPEIAKWIGNREFRRALALGIDRDQMNQAFWLGVGTPSSVVPEDSSPYNPGPEWRTKWSTLDVKTANEMLDKLGLEKKDSEGYRVRTDNGQRLRLEIMAPGGAIVPFTPHVEMVAQHWKKIGIQADVKETERGLSMTRVGANEHQIMSWSVSGSEHLLLYPDNTLPVLPTSSYAGPLFGKWFASGGTAGKKPSDPKILEMMDLFRAAPGMPTEQRVKAVQDIWKIVVDEQWLIGTVGLSPAALGVRIVKNNIGNIPARQANAQHARTPGSSHPATFFFKS
jgi:peptide/nickel transport system substrate-binding protein